MKSLKRVQIVESLGQNMDSVIHESIAGEQRIVFALQKPVWRLLEILANRFCVWVDNSVSGDVNILIGVLFYIDLVQI